MNKQHTFNRKLPCNHESKFVLAKTKLSFEFSIKDKKT